MGKWKPSKARVKEFTQKMDQISDFCAQNGISKSRSGDSYYFSVDDKDYRVSNHTIDASDANADLRGFAWHKPDADLICITAGKTRIVEIYTNLKNGLKLDKRGNVINENII